MYLGDQGFLSFCYAGEIKYWGYPEEKQLSVTPYNFHMSWYNGELKKAPEPRPVIIHFVGQVKPWTLKYPIEIEYWKKKLKEVHYFDELKLGQAEWYYLWHEYALMVDAIVNG